MEITLSMTFERTFQVPKEIENNEKEIEKFIDECLSSKEMLSNITDFGEINRK